MSEKPNDSRRYFATIGLVGSDGAMALRLADGRSVGVSTREIAGSLYSFHAGQRVVCSIFRRGDGAWRGFDLAPA